MSPGVFPDHPNLLGYFGRTDRRRLTGVADAATRNRRVEELVRRCHAGLSTAELSAEVVRRLRGVMTIDAAFFASVDPATLLFTGMTSEEPLASAATLFLENEFGQPDVNKFTTLASSRLPVQSLDDVTEHDRNRSARYRDVMAPLGLGDELRAAFRVDSATWGVICLHREDGPTGFSEDDASILGRVAPHIAEGLRRALLLERAGDDEELGEPGVIVLESDLSISAITPGADRWMREVAGAWPTAGELPLPIYAVALRLLALDEVVPPRLRFRDPKGRWITLHAAHLEGKDGGLAVVLEPARPADAVSVMLLAHGLTSREAEVAQLVVRGFSTRQIVDQLHISAHTVQDHLKSVFDKTGVRSRRELVAHLLRTPH